MLRRPIACALLLWYLAACTTWHVEKGVSPSQLISTKHPTAVRLNLADGSRMDLLEPRITAGDSVAGVLRGTPAKVAVSDVTQVAIRKVDAGKTIGLALGITAGYGLLAAMVWAYCGSVSSTMCPTRD